MFTSNTHMLINHTEIQNHLTRKYEKLATRNVQLAKYELNWTRKLKLATRTFQLATRTRNSNSQLATRNLQLAEYLDPFSLGLGYACLFSIQMKPSYYSWFLSFKDRKVILVACNIMAGPMGHLTIKFKSNILNNLWSLFLAFPEGNNTFCKCPCQAW